MDMQENDIWNLLEKAYQKRIGLKTITNAMRIVHGFDDGMDGLVLEQYHQHGVAQIFHQRWFKYRACLEEFMRKYCQIKHFVVKDRTQTASSDAHHIKMDVWVDGGSSKTIVEEYGVKFLVDMQETLNTGLFLDMRANRRKISLLAKNKKVFNGFSYTCSFGVHCRLQGAESVVNVDVSKKILEKGRENYVLNGLEPQKNELIRADVVEYLQKAVQKKNMFDVMIIDPPSFARHEGRVFHIKKDLPLLLKMAAHVLNPQGHLLIASNFTEIDHPFLLDMIEDAFCDRRIRLKECLGQDVDFFS